MSDLSDGETVVTTIDEIKYDDRGLVVTVIQEDETGEVLMVAYMNRESLGMTLETGRTVFWSRSRQELWAKGDTSGHVQKVKKILYDCDADALLIRVDQVGAACHTGKHSCFYRELDL